MSGLSLSNSNSRKSKPSDSRVEMELETLKDTFEKKADEKFEEEEPWRKNPFYSNFPGDANDEKKSEGNSESDWKLGYDDSMYWNTELKNGGIRADFATNLGFLTTPPMRKSDGLIHMTFTEKCLFEHRVLLSMDEINHLHQEPQGGAFWLGIRTVPSDTSSKSGDMLGLTPYKDALPINSAFRSVYQNFKGIPQTQWGIDIENYISQSYVNELTLRVVKAFRNQRKKGMVHSKHLFFTFRGQKIPVPDLNKDPVVECKNNSTMAIPGYHAGKHSNDDIVFINGVACGLAEYKAPAPKKLLPNEFIYVNHDKKRVESVNEFFQDRFVLYPDTPIYQYSQLQRNLYATRYYFPTIRWIDHVPCTSFCTAKICIHF